ncbi:ftsX-like permease family protein [Mycobacterium kansasii]|uniref:FtsX-like permease family protein n=1 Tax=Mycobacterium kansasii TaxID=1768 RepID=A0A1V3XYJ7_MYCKA|nr:ftsX-like permease family protein [Mycobacterium kansasii]
MIRMSASTPSGPVLLFGADGRSAELSGALKDALKNIGAQPLNAPSTTPAGVQVGPGTGYPKGDTFRLGSASVTVVEVLGGRRLAELNGGRYVLAPLALAQRVTGRQGRLDSILITTQPGADLAAVRAGVIAAVNGRAIVAYPNMRATRAGDGVKLMNYMALMGAGVALLVGAFLIYTTMTMTIAQRRPVISLLRAIGGRRVTIVGDLLAEAALLGLIGGAIGSCSGIILGRMAIGRLPPAMTQGLEARVEYLLPGYALPVALATTMLTSVAASAMAARQVYRVSPIEALAPVGGSSADVVPRWLRVTTGAAAVTIFAASTLVVVDHRVRYALAAMLALFGAEIALGFALTAPVVGAVAATARRFGPVGALAAATIQRAPRRVWATVMTVLIAVVTTVVISGTNSDMISSAREIFAPVAGVDVWVSADPPGRYPTGPLPQGLSEQLAAVPGVARVIEGAAAFAVVGGTRVLLDGFSPEPPIRSTARWMIGCARRCWPGGRGAYPGSGCGAAGAGRRPAAVGHPHGRQRPTVLALVPYFSTVIGTVGMSLDQMRSWFDRPAATTLQITAAPGVDRHRLSDNVRRAVPPPDYVYDGRAALTGAEAPLHQSMFIADAVWIIVVFVATVALLNTLTLSVLERRREIGVLRATGCSRRFTVQMVLAEAAGIGVVGGAAGLALGLTDQWLYSLVSADAMNFAVGFRPGPTALVLTVGAVAVSLLGSAPPAVRAARLNIIEALGLE